MFVLTDMSESDRRTLSVALAKAIMVKLDADQDGHITKQEFVQGCAGEPRIYDIMTSAFVVGE